MNHSILRLERSELVQRFWSACELGRNNKDDACLGVVLDLAREIVLMDCAREFRQTDCFETPRKVQEWLQLRFKGLEQEVFYVLFLDSQNRLIEAEEMFRGTLTQASVYPREVVKRALQLNAGAVVLAHNHPSGVPEPSRSDEALTSSLRTALSVIDVRILDHIVVAGTQSVSFAERGLI